MDDFRLSVGTPAVRWETTRLREPRVPAVAMVGAGVAHPGAAAETRYTSLLTLFSEHGSGLTHSQRAQHLSVAQLDLGKVHFSAFFVLAPFTLRKLSAFFYSCEAQTSAAPTVDDEEPALIALFSLIASACGSLGADAANDLARQPFPAEEAACDPSPPPDEIGGLFGRPAIAQPPAPTPGAVLPTAFSPDGHALTSVRRALRTAPLDVQAAAAHLTHLAFDAVSQQRAVRVRAAALTALCALARVLPARLLAFFFPGVASKTLKLLGNVRLHQSVLAILALDLLSVSIAAVFPARVAPEAPDDQKSFAALVGSLRESEAPPKAASVPAALPARPRAATPPKRQRLQSLFVTLDVAWHSKSSQNLSPLLRGALESGDGPRPHAHPGARGALAIFLACATLRDAPLRLAPVPRWQCVFALAELAADDFPDVAAAATARLRASARSSAARAEELETALRALVAHVSQLPVAVAIAGGAASAHDHADFADGSDSDAMEALESLWPARDAAQGWTRPLCGLLRALGARDVARVLARVRGDAIVLALVALQASTAAQGALAGPEDYAALRTPSTDACYDLGAAGVLPALAGPLLRVAERLRDAGAPGDATAPRAASTQKVVHHAHAALCLQAMVRGALAGADARADAENAQMARHAGDALACAAAVALPAAEDADDRAVRAKVAALMAAAQLCDALRGACGAARRTLALPVLMPLLADAAREEPAVADAARSALAALAAATGGGGVRALVHRHANFLVARLVRALHTEDAARVLAYVVQSGSGTVGDRVVALAEDALARQCDDLAAATDLRAAAALDALHAVLAAAPQPRPARAGRGAAEPNNGEAGAGRERREVTAALMAMCTEDVPDARDEAAAARSGGKEEEEDDDEEEELNDEERERRRTPTARVARRALLGAADVLVGRPAAVRARALAVAACGVGVLADDRRALLPAAAALLPLLPAQLDAGGAKRGRGGAHGGAAGRVNALAAELPVVGAACALLTALVRAARSFVRSRFVRDVFPALRPLLAVAAAAAEAGPADARQEAHGTGVVAAEESEEEEEGASFGASRAADAALECVAAVATCTPDALRPFAEELLGYVARYVAPRRDARPRAPRGPGFARRRYERERAARRARWAEEIVRGVARADPDRTWTWLVAQGARQRVVHCESGVRTLKVR